MFMGYSKGNQEANHKQAELKGLEASRAAALTGAEVISINAAARQAVIKAAVDAGKPIDYNAASRAGQQAVEAARVAKVPGRVSE